MEQEQGIETLARPSIDITELSSIQYNGSTWTANTSAGNFNTTGQLNIGGTTPVDYGQYFYYPNYFYQYIYTPLYGAIAYATPSRVESAFKAVSALLKEGKLGKNISAKQFTEWVKIVSDAL